MASFNELIPTLEHNTFGDGLHALEGTLRLPVWAGFQSRAGSYGSIGNPLDSDGLVRLNVEGDFSTPAPTVSAEQVKAYDYVQQHQQTMQDALMAALFTRYKNMQREYRYSPEKASQLMPDVTAIYGRRLSESAAKNIDR